jgi:hypothetical protein
MEDTLIFSDRIPMTSFQIDSRKYCFIFANGAVHPESPTRVDYLNMFPRSEDKSPLITHTGLRQSYQSFSSCDQFQIYH